MRKINIEIKWAVIFTIALLCWILFEKTMGWDNENISEHWWLTLLFGPFAILLYLLALREKRRIVFGESMTFLQGFISGVIISLFVALLSPLTEYIAYNILTPEYFNTIGESSVTNELMTKSRMNNLLNINNYRWQSVFGLFWFGVVNSIIAAFFVRRK